MSKLAISPTLDLIVTFSLKAPTPLSQKLIKISLSSKTMKEDKAMKREDSAVKLIAAKKDSSFRIMVHPKPCTLMMDIQNYQIPLMKTIKADSHKFIIKASDRLIPSFSQKIHLNHTNRKQSILVIRYLKPSKELPNQSWCLRQHLANKASTWYKHSSSEANTKATNSMG